MKKLYIIIYIIIINLIYIISSLIMILPIHYYQLLYKSKSNIYSYILILIQKIIYTINAHYFFGFFTFIFFIVLITCVNHLC